ncbi:hypothetical protein GCM10010913_44590 [Paenibacillus aceti]|uniref:Uncharacterized protein n=1 Tax=Paenibacillus aceti TaxID=1820010 RepID=A0ABQ1W7M9_9BACL|nr:hypothetical protein GCM10010913_44590 [Paenibacillus aceti]
MVGAILPRLIANGQNRIYRNNNDDEQNNHGDKNDFTVFSYKLFAQLRDKATYQPKQDFVENGRRHRRK